MFKKGKFNVLKKIIRKLDQSIRDNKGKVSHTRISSYIILSSILISSALFGTIEVMNAVKMWSLDKTYTIPVEHITIFGMILTHHLFLLGIKKSGEKYNTEIEDIENLVKGGDDED